MTRLQEITGLELTALIEDPEHASVRQIVSEAMGVHRSGGGGGEAAVTGSSMQQRIMSPWISPAPITIKLRLFCLPYAGGISENVYSK